MPNLNNILTGVYSFKKIYVIFILHRQPQRDVGKAWLAHGNIISQN